MFCLLVFASYVSSGSAMILRSALELESRAEFSMKALIKDATSRESAGIYKGMRAPQNQDGYEMALGNTEMTAFIQRRLDEEQLRVKDVGALQGFVMYYDGTCTKKAWDELVAELSPRMAQTCHKEWLGHDTSIGKPTGVNLMESRRQRSVSKLEYDALMQREYLLERAAGYSAAKFVGKGTGTLRLQRFVLTFIHEMKGIVTDEQGFAKFVEQMAQKLKDEKPDYALDALIEAMYDAAEEPGSFLRMTVPESRSVMVAEKSDAIQPSDVWGDDQWPDPEPATGAGLSEPISNDGFHRIHDGKNLADLAAYINRTAASIGYQVIKADNLEPFAKWYNAKCASQYVSHIEGLMAEIKVSATRPIECGGGWVKAMANYVPQSEEATAEPS